MAVNLTDDRLPRGHHIDQLRNHLAHGHSRPARPDV
jgi:hypothetical protein